MFRISFGYSKLLDPAAFDRNIESVTKENKYYFRCMNTDSICIFTDNGNVHQIKVSDIPTKKVREKRGYLLIILEITVAKVKA